MEAQPYIRGGGKFPIVSVFIIREKEYSTLRKKNFTSCRRCLPGLLKPGLAVPTGCAAANPALLFHVGKGGGTAVNG